MSSKLPRRREQARPLHKTHLAALRVEALEERRLLSLSPADLLAARAGIAGLGPISPGLPGPDGPSEKVVVDMATPAYALRDAGQQSPPSLPSSVDEVVPITWNGTPTWQEQGGWIARFDTGASLRDQQVELIGQSINGLAARVSRSLGLDGAVLLRTPGDVSFEFLSARLSTIPGFRYIEPNIVEQQLAAVPDDPRYPDQYHLDNTGQTGGTADADIDAPEAWDITTGNSSVVVGVIDSGIDVDHPDLIDNLWVNPGETPGNGIDDDGNGYIDDVHGFDFIDQDPNPDDSHGHGTHVAGITGAVGDNGEGVSGVAWDVQLMGLRIFNTFGSTSNAAILEAVNYAVMMKRDQGVNIPITNNSWGGGPFSQALLDVINEAEAADQLFIAAAGNGFGNNNDANPFFPASYPSPNIISVASTDHNDALSGFSNLGATSVDVAAPGSSILSTAPPNGSTVSHPSGYAAISGTSMATPVVSGIAALGYSLLPSADYETMRDAIFASVDPMATLDGRVATGGRVNARNTLIALDAMAVVGTTPADGEIVDTTPTEFVVDFSFPYDPASVDASDLTVNGIPADSVVLTDANTLSFSYTTSPVSIEGVQTISMAEGAVTQLSDGDPLQPYSAGFRYDAIALEVVSTSPPAGSSVELPLSSIRLDFSEEVDPASVDLGDVLSSRGTITALTPVDDDSLEVTIEGLDSEGPLTLTVPAGRLLDDAGNANLMFQAGYILDFGVIPYPSPLVADLPPGSLAYDSAVSGIIGTSGDVDTFTLDLDPGQSIAVVADPSGALQLEVALLDGDGNPVASQSTGNPGETASIPAVRLPGVITEAGPVQSYSIAVTGLGSTTGSYDLRVLFNADLEPERFGGPDNDSTGSAQPLEGSFLPLATVDALPSGAHPERAVVSGRVNGDGYLGTAETFEFQDISGTGNASLVGTDDSRVFLSSSDLDGFEFDFYGQSYSSLYYSSNGLITFGSGNSSFSNSDLTTSPSQAAIAPYWHDLVVPSGSGAVYWEVIGSGDDQQLVLQWDAVEYFPGSSPLTFQAILSEADGSIRFNYEQDSSNFAFGTVGLKDAGTQGPDRLLLSFADGPNTFVGNAQSTRIELVDADVDVFAIELDALETVSLSATVAGSGQVGLTLLDPSGVPMAMGHGSAGNSENTIVEYLAPSSGTYYARVEGAGEYQLVVARNASFEAEPNDHLGAAHSVHNRLTGGLRYVMGQISTNDVVLDAFDLGWYDNTGLHNSTNTNYLAGAISGVGVHHNFFAFDLVDVDPGAELAGARLRAYNPPGGLVSPDPTETFEVFDVSTPIDDLLAGGTGQTGTFDDLGGGTSFGSEVVSFGEHDGAVVEVELNPEALAELQAAIGSRFALGGALTTLDSGLDEHIFGFSGSPFDPTPQLVLSTVESDFYEITVPGNRPLTIETLTPAGGPGAFDNPLDPVLRLYDASGNLLDSDEDGAADGRNARITHRTPRSDSRTYFVEVLSQGNTSGDYVLSVHWANGVHPPFEVVASDPEPGAVRGSADTITVDFDDNILLPSVDPSDLLINGVPASGVEVVDGNTLTFSHDVEFPAGEVTEVSISIAPDAILDTQGKGVSAFTSSFTVDRQPPRIVSASIAEGDVFEPGDLSVSITFDEPMNTSVIDPSDTDLTGLYRGNNVTPIMTWDPTGTVLTLDYFNLPDDGYRLTLFSGDLAFEDLVGVDLDGEPGSFPTGDGIEGGNFVLEFALDPVDPAGVPGFSPVPPLGSLIHETSSGDGTIAFPADVDTFEVLVDPGQTISVLIGTNPLGLLQPSIELLDPSDTVVASATAGAPGDPALLQTAPLAVGGTYTINVSGAAGTLGVYSLPIIALNAALEEEAALGLPNDEFSTAQDIDGAFIALDSQADRAGVIGLADGVELSYVAQAVTPEFEDISGTGTPSLIGADDSNAFLSSSDLDGFEFDFYGQSYSSLYYSSNGLITFDSGNSRFANSDLTTFPSQAAIAPLWDDLELFSGDGAVYWEVLGSGDDQRLVIQWHEVDYFSSNPGDITFQAVLFEADGSIQFNYLDLAGGDPFQDEGASATVGVKDAGPQGSNRLLVSFNAGPNAFVGSGLSTRISPEGLEFFPDHYTFTAEADQTITAALTFPGSSGETLLELYDPGGVLVATGTASADNVSSILRDVVAPSTGTYTLRVGGDGGYSLVVNRGASFDAEPNNDFDSAQDIGASRAILGAFEPPAPSVVPGNLAQTLGNSGNAWPFHSGDFGFEQMRYQQIYSASEFDTAGIIDTIRFRLANPNSSFDATGIDTEVRLSYAATTVATVSETFASNIGAGQVLVFDGPLDLSSSGNGFDIIIDVDDLFDYDPTQGDLLVEIRTTGSPITDFFDASGGGEQDATTRVYAFDTSASTGTVNFSGPGDDPYGLVTAFDILADSGEEDWYAITLAAGQSLSMTTLTPGDGPGAFDNTLDPMIELYDPSGSLVATSTDLGDGRNEELTHSATSSGSYRIRVVAEDGSTGAYVVSTEISDSPTSIFGGGSRGPIAPPGSGGGFGSMLRVSTRSGGPIAPSSFPSTPFSPTPTPTPTPSPTPGLDAGFSAEGLTSDRPTPPVHSGVPDDTPAFADRVDELLDQPGDLLSRSVFDRLGLGLRSRATVDDPVEDSEQAPGSTISVDLGRIPESGSIDRPSPNQPADRASQPLFPPDLLAKAGPIPLIAPPEADSTGRPTQDLDRKTRPGQLD